MSTQFSDAKVIGNQSTHLHAKWGVQVRRVALVLVLFGEVLALTIRFDSSTLAKDGPLLGALTEKFAASIPQVLAVVLTATLIFGGRTISESISQISASVSRHRGWSFWLMVHLVSFSAFACVTHYVFEVDRGSSAIFMTVWLMLAFATLTTWLATLVPIVDWLDLGRGLIGPVLIGAIMGTVGWLAGQWSIQYWETLAYWTFRLVGWLLFASGIEVSQNIEQFVIGTSQFSVQIAPACSGYEGMGLAAVFLTTYLWWCRREHFFPQAILLIPISIGLMFLANVIRIALLIFIGHCGWQEFALGGFHSQAGWLAFNLVALGLVALARTSPFFSRPILVESRATKSSAVPMLSPFIALTLTIMVTGALQLGFDWMYPVRFFAVCIAISFVLKQLRPEVWKWTWDWAGPSFGVGVFMIWLILEPSGSGANQIPFDEARSQTPILFAAWLLFRILGSVVTVPIAEEFAFRGYLLPWLSPSTNDGPESMKWSWFALLLSSAAFSALHPGRWIAGMAAGCLYGIAFYRRKLVMDAVIAHATTNGLIAIVVLYRSQWNLWS